jgi:MoxR-like ATPase
MSSLPMPERAKQFRQAYHTVYQEISKAVVGHADIVHGILTCLFVGGHALLEGVPGLGKTLLVRTLSQVLSLHFSRVQFTPDLMPSDIIGTNIINETAEGQRVFTFQPGPLFAQIVLADEINRATPKTQSALLEAMQEHSVTVGGTVHKLDEPFFVMATQNPIEQEGTYPLPLAQLDRFMFKVRVNYPSPEEERHVLRDHHATGALSDPRKMGVQVVVSPPEIIAARQAIRATHVRDEVVSYVQQLLTATRQDDSLAVGASPRSGLMLLMGAKGLARFAGRDFVTPDDIQTAFLPALRHRVVLTATSELEGTTTDEVLAQLLEAVEVPR